MSGMAAKKCSAREGPVQPDLDQADLLALAVQIVDHFFDDLTAEAHGDDDAVGVRVADIVKQIVRRPVRSPTFFMSPSTISGTFR